MKPATRYRMGRVQVTKHHVDFAEADPERMQDLTLAVTERILAAPHQTGCHYFCPEYTLAAPDDVPETEFLQQARRAQALWCKKLNRFLRRELGGKAKKRLARSLPEVERALLIGGILFLHGKDYHPKGWPDSGSRAS